METKDDRFTCEFWNSNIRKDGWVELTDFNLPKEYGKRKKAVLEIRRCEREMRESGFEGWLAWCRVYDYKMLSLFVGLLARAYYSDGQNMVFFKLVKGVDSG